MTRNRKVALLLGVLLASIIWWLQSDSTSEPIGFGQVAVISADKVGGGSGDVTLRQPILGERVAGPGTARREVAREANPSGIVQRRYKLQPRAGGILVRLVDERTGEPVPGAEVAVFADWIDEAMAAALLHESLDAWVPEDAAWYKADAQGHLRIPQSWGRRLLVAQSSSAPGHLHGLLEIRTKDQKLAKEQTVAMRPAIPLTVRVVDGAGSPVPGIRIGFREWEDEFWFLKGITQVTDAGGYGQFFHVDLILPAWLDSGPARVMAEVLGPLCEVPFDPLAIPLAPLVLTVPQGVEIEVRATDGKGALLQGEPVEFELNPPLDWEGGIWSTSATTVSGAHIFRAVPPGAVFGVKAIRNAAWLPATAEFKTPESPGGRIVVDLVFDQPAWVLRGRLVYPDGSALRDTSFQAAFHRRDLGNARRWIREAKTDDEGNFELQSGESFSVKAGDRWFLEASLDGADVKDSLGISVDFPSGYRGGILELGDIVLGEPPLLVGGTVVDQSGMPLLLATIGVEVPQRSSSTGVIRTQRSGDQVLVTHRGAWPASSTVGGLFEVRGVPVGGLVAVTASLRGYTLKERALVQEGTSNVRLVLQQAGELRGSLLVSEGHVGSGWAIALVPAGVPVTAWAGRAESGYRGTYSYPRLNASYSVSEDGNFDLRGLVPGLYDLAVAHKREGDSRVLVQGISVVAGEICMDDRLQKIDPNAGFTELSLTITDALGAAVAQAQVFVRDGENYVLLEELDGAATAALWLPKTPVDLLVTAPEYRDVFLDATSTDQSVVMEDGLPVRLVLDTPPTLPETAELRVRLLALPERFGAAGGQYDEVTGFNSQGEYSGLVGGPGEYRVGFILVVVSDGGTMTSAGWLAGSQTIEVGDLGVEQCFQLPVPQGEIDELLEKLLGSL